MKEDIAFDNWCKDLDDRWLRFQVDTAVDKDRDSYFMHNNLAGYDRMIRALRKHNNPCKAPGCGLPLPPSKNYVILGYGDVCVTCWNMYTIISSNVYFKALHDWEKRNRWTDSGNRGLGRV